jgi:hypothetical protein
VPRETVVQRVVDQCCEQVVRARDGMEVAVEMQVDVHHRQQLGAAAAGASALHAEDGTEARLAQRRGPANTDACEALREANRHRGLALACRCRRDRRNQHEAPGLRSGGERRQWQFRLVATVRLEHRRVDADRARHLANGFHRLTVFVFRPRPGGPRVSCGFGRGVLHTAGVRRIGTVADRRANASGQRSMCSSSRCATRRPEFNAPPTVPASPPRSHASPAK